MGSTIIFLSKYIHINNIYIFFFLLGATAFSEGEESSPEYAALLEVAGPQSMS